jgi:hypothetical protein
VCVCVCVCVCVYTYTYDLRIYTELCGSVQTLDERDGEHGAAGRGGTAGGTHRTTPTRKRGDAALTYTT